MFRKYLLIGVLEFIQPTAEVTAIAVNKVNQAAISLTNNLVSSARSLNIEFCHHSSRTLSVDGVVRRIRIASKE